MNKISLIAGLLLVGVAAIAATPTASAAPTYCAVEYAACYCTDTSGMTCEGTTAKECAVAVGPTKDIMVGADCKVPIFLPWIEN